MSLVWYSHLRMHLFAKSFKIAIVMDAVEVNQRTSGSVKKKIIIAIRWERRRLTFIEWLR